MILLGFSKSSVSPLVPKRKGVLESAFSLFNLIEKCVVLRIFGIPQAVRRRPSWQRWAPFFFALGSNFELWYVAIKALKQGELSSFLHCLVGALVLKGK